MGKGEKVVVYYGMPIWHGLHTRQNYFAKSYQRIGCNVYYLCKPNSIFSSGLQKRTKENIHGINIINARNTFMPQSSLLGTLEIKLILFSELCRVWSVHNRIDLIFVRLPNTYFSFLTSLFKTVYDVVDDYSIYAKRKVHKKRVIKSHYRLHKRVFKTLFTNTQLQHNLGSNYPSIIIPNGVEFDNFNQPINADAHCVLFIGLLSNWLNWPLISRLIDSYGKDFLIIGPESNDLDKKYRDILSKGNTLGMIPQGGMRPYLAVSKVCVMPYSWSDLNSGRTPLKLYEYLATGLEVVSIGYPLFKRNQDLSGLVQFVDNDEEFLQAVSNGMNEQLSKIKMDKRKRIAKKMSWSNLFDDLVVEIG